MGTYTGRARMYARGKKPTKCDAQLCPGWTTSQIVFFAVAGGADFFSVVVDDDDDDNEPAFAARTVAVCVDARVNP